MDDLEKRIANLDEDDIRELIDGLKAMSRKQETVEPSGDETVKMRDALKETYEKKQD